MTRKFLLTILLVYGSSDSALAQVMTYLHEGQPAFSLTYPGGWDIRTSRAKDKNLMSAMPSDGSILWQGVWVVREVGTIGEAEQTLQDMEHRLFEDVKQTREPWTENIGPLQVRCREGSGLYNNSGIIETLICVFQLTDSRVGAFAYMGDPEAISLHRSELQEIAGSLEIVEK